MRVPQKWPNTQKKVITTCVTSVDVVGLGLVKAHTLPKWASKHHTIYFLWSIHHVEGSCQGGSQGIQGECSQVTQP